MSSNSKRQIKLSKTNNMTLKVLLPCDLSTWPPVSQYLSVLASGLDSIQDAIVVFLQIHDLCNVPVLSNTPARRHDEHIFDELLTVIDRQFPPQDRERFLKKTLPCIARYAGALPQLQRSAKFNLTLASQPHKLELDRRFVASLAANAFLSTLPLRGKGLLPLGLPDLTFATLFPGLSTDFCSALRFKSFLEYFDILEEEGPCGKVSYELHVLKDKKSDNSNDITELKKEERKPLAPVFIMEEDVRPLDLTSSVETLVIRDISNLTEMNFQHPELVPLLMSFEPLLKENEWIQVDKNIISS